MDAVDEALANFPEFDPATLVDDPDAERRWELQRDLVGTLEMQFERPARDGGAG